MNAIPLPLSDAAAPLRLDAEGRLKLRIDDLIGERIAVLGIPGSGKSYSARVLAEEILPHMPMAIIDIDGEYHTLAERFPLLRVCGGAAGESFPDAARLATDSVTGRTSVLLDFSEHDQEFMFEYLDAFFGRMWTLTSSTENRRPYAVLIEEAHVFVPQARMTAIKRSVQNLTARGRKRGITTILVSQRSAKVDKDVLTSCGLYFLHMVQHPSDVATYEGLVPRPRQAVREMIAGLKVGQAIVQRGRDVRVVHMRTAMTRHAGVTPGLARRADAERKPVVFYARDGAMLAEMDFMAELDEPVRTAQILADDWNRTLMARDLAVFARQGVTDAARRLLTRYAANVWRGCEAKGGFWEG